MSRLPIIAVSMGDPGGIGPEVVVKALADPELRSSARWLICGNRAPLAAAAMRSPNAPTIRDMASGTAPESLAPGDVVLYQHAALSMADIAAKPTAQGGAASLAYVEQAIAFAQGAGPLSGWRADAVVTAPISKEAWVLGGERRYPGHTELFAERFASPRSAMMFIAAPGTPTDTSPAAGLNVILATAHIPLQAVASTLTTNRVLDAILLGAAALRGLGFASPRVGVCGLNPHAGEHGVLGMEDDAIIAPAIALARTQGVDATGPFPADTIFQAALALPGRPARRFDLVVAMYHDQGLIPVKLLAFDRAVNITVGLMHQGRGIVRTSPDHGTAYDIAGQGVADAGSMHAAMHLAARLASA